MWEMIKYGDTDCLKISISFGPTMDFWVSHIEPNGKENGVLVDPNLLSKI